MQKSQNRGDNPEPVVSVCAGKGGGTDKSDSQQGVGFSCTVADKSGDEGWQAFVELW